MSNVPAAAQALDILRLLGRRAAPVPAAVIAQELGLPRSTVYHQLAVLRERGFVVHLTQDRRYGLGTAALELGSASSRQEPLRWIAQTILSRLVSRTRQNGHFAGLDGRDVLYLLEERAPERPSLVTEVGVRLPAQLTASGIAMLAALPPGHIRALWPSRHDLARRTDAGPTSLTALRRLLADTRRAGVAYENGSVTRGFASVAAAVPDHNSYPVAAVALTFPAEEVNNVARSALADEVVAAAHLVARRIRGQTADLIRSPLVFSDPELQTVSAAGVGSYRFDRGGSPPSEPDR